MNKEKNILRGAFILLTSIFLSAGCGHRQQINNHTVDHLKVDTVVPLQASHAEPSCTFSVDFSYLRADAGADAHEDSVVQAINTTLVGQLLGEDYATLPTADAVQLFKTNYLNDYRQDMQELYAEDLKNQVAADELPTWYNRNFELTTEMTDGYEGILCTRASIYEFAGGAHPNLWEIWMNFRLADGHLLTTDEVFIPALQDEVSARLLDALLAWAKKSLEGTDVQTIADLQNQGVLLTSQLYVPENFLLSADEVRFVYNRYDIAPYAAGAIELALPYSQIHDCIDWEALKGSAPTE